MKSSDTSCVEICQSSVHPALQKGRKGIFKNCQCLLRGHTFSRSRWDPVFAKFCQRHPWKRVAFDLTIQMILISAFKSFFHSQSFEIPPSLPFLSVLKMLHKKLSRYFHSNMINTKSGLYPNPSSTTC